MEWIKRLFLWEIEKQEIRMKDRDIINRTIIKNTAMENMKEENTKKKVAAAAAGHSRPPLSITISERKLIQLLRLLPSAQ